MKNFKILMINLGYLTGINGSFKDYIFKSHRYLLNSERIRNKLTSKLKNIMKKERPDLILLIEVRKSQIQEIITKDYPFYKFQLKYGKNSRLRKIPIFKNQGNAFISKSNLNFKEHFLKYGTKRLLYEIELPKNIKVLMAHFSLNKKTRKKQFKEISDKFKNRNLKIICGDFNIFDGLKEIEIFLKGKKLKLASKEPTFPAFNPKIPLDLFICSKQLKIFSRVIKTKISDHLPVIIGVHI